MDYWIGSALKHGVFTLILTYNYVLYVFMVVLVYFMMACTFAWPHDS